MTAGGESVPVDVPARPTFGGRPSARGPPDTEPSVEFELG